MAEIGVLHELVTPLGTLSFNQWALSDYMRLTAVDGMDLAVLAREVHELAGRDGAGPLPAAFRQALYPAFAGDIVAATRTTKRQKADDLRAYLASITNTDGTLRWTPSGTTQRQRTVRLHDGPTIGQGQRKDPFQFTLVAADPLAYSVTLQTSANIAANSAAVNVTNGGNAPSWPTLRIYGAVTSPILRNTTTGKRLEFDYGAGLVIADGTYIEIDTRLERVVLVSTGVSQIGPLDPLTSEFWQLATGVNAIDLLGTAPGVNAKAVVLHRDAWWG